jgi:hypothetical protein
MIDELEKLQKLGVKRFKKHLADYEVEFFPPQPTPMDLSPPAIAKALADSMPPDNDMMFASTEEPQSPLIHSNGNTEPVT